jgi:predicted glycoside hydrolase/deacetylase ChbG (UPF0249 family)
MLNGCDVFYCYAESEVKVIINADDLGANATVNQAIFGLMAEGKITSATVLANGAEVDAAVAQMRFFPQCSFGVHLNATQWMPLRPTAGLQPILNDGGQFTGRQLKTRITRRLTAAIEAEWEAQVERLLELGVPVTHLDSHHFIHTIPQLMPVLRRLMQRYGIHRMRSRYTFKWPPESMMKQWYNHTYNTVLRRWTRCVSADALGDFRAFHFAEAIVARNARTVELIVHPGHPHDVYTSETRLLSTEINKDFRERHRLISYAELPISPNVD